MIDPKIITVRSNLYLWLLTGRSGDFKNESLNGGSAFSITDTPGEVQRLRKLLRLDQVNSDVHVIAVLAAAKMSTSLVRTMPHEQDIVFVNGILTLPESESSHELLPADGHSWPSIDGAAAGQYNFTQMSFKDLGGGKAQITTDGDYNGFTDYTKTTEDGGTYRIAFHKGSELGLRAHVRVGSWVPGDVVAVKVAPTQYPFKTVSETILGNSEARRLMNAEGVMPAFAESSNAARRVGLCGLAVIRRMLRFLNDDQLGFIVTTSQDPDSAEPLARVYDIDPTFSAGLNVEGDEFKDPVGFDA